MKPGPRWTPSAAMNASTTPRRAALAALAAAGCAVAFRSAPARAAVPMPAVPMPTVPMPDVAILIGPRQAIGGDVPPGEPIRIRSPIVKGGRPRLKLRLSGGTKLRPISFQSVKLFGPDGDEIAVPQEHLTQSHVPGRDTVYFRGFAVPETGLYEIVIRTNSTVASEARGKFMVDRELSIPFSGDETSTDVNVDLQESDGSQCTVQRVSGTAPNIAQYRPVGLPATNLPPQRASRKGSVGNAFGAFLDGTYGYRIGYQDSGPPEGRFKGRVKVIPFRGYGTEYFALENPPGVALTVRDVDRYLQVPYGGVGCRIDFDGQFLFVTSGAAGKVQGQRFDINLDPIQGDAGPTDLATDADLPPGETIDGHRLVYADQHHVLSINSQSGKDLAVMQFRADNLVRTGFQSLTSTATSSTLDHFLATDQLTISVGRHDGAGGHVVHLIDSETFLPFGTVPIGQGAHPQFRGSGCVWRTDTMQFELWTPDTTLFGQPSDLHRQRFTEGWVTVGADAVPVADPVLVETHPTGVAFDDVADVVILHYVVPTNNVTGAGTVHRVLYDAAGAEIPGSRATLPGERHRPHAVLAGGRLFLACDTAQGPVVERYRLLR
ncbi:MAG: hypothetical protein HMLKMBBP_00370 [Planctomycetes bacterium]|nr:hypothetical protein [Planctomycetota bacterium]